MKRLLTLIAATAIAAQGGLALAGPEEDRAAFENYFTKKFPDTPLDDFINGVYSIDPPSREQWVEIEEFPPYELNLDEGKAFFEKAFANGKSMGDCFDNGGIGVRQNYPYFDVDRGEVVTLELAINECLEANGEEKLKYSKGKMASVSAYMNFTSRGETINVVIPDDPRAQQAFENGKQFFYTKRGQLNFSCFDCHGTGSGGYIRADKLSPALGHVSHFPVYRSKWGGMGTLHRRFGGCNKQVRAAPFKSQSVEYRELEYFLTYMSNGLTYNGPGARK